MTDINIKIKIAVARTGAKQVRKDDIEMKTEEEGK